MRKIIFLLRYYCWYSCGSHGTNNTTKSIKAVCLLNSASGSSVEGKAVFTEINNKVTLEIDVKGLSFGFMHFIFMNLVTAVLLMQSQLVAIGIQIIINMENGGPNLIIRETLLICLLIPRVGVV